MPALNICGVLVHARPERSAGVRTALEQFPGVEVHAVGTDGRMVVTVEDDSGAMTTQTIAAFHDIDGVLSAALVYHQWEEQPDTEEHSR